MHQYKSKEQRCREELAEIGAELVSWSPIVVRIPKDQLDVKLAAKVILHRYDVILAEDLTSSDGDVMVTEEDPNL